MMDMADMTLESTLEMYREASKAIMMIMVGEAGKIQESGEFKVVENWDQELKNIITIFSEAIPVMFKKFMEADGGIPAQYVLVVLSSLMVTICETVFYKKENL